ncbi:MFS transporter [Mycolicibacterium wolinskyi]|uniref:Arabinose ABC transporter permease n=1 Tax=Mycolicibacterium wolinskyi TaxID=59750 RepID=A0A1X2F8L2_9MYCO|nr:MULTISPECIES: MFS transporter [Mycolicibacterium]MCV7286487.1 MFS transporter [Mycolicibacterium wolinskyi]MCV7293467.1 MFS transporter [Mycolicibacterium goodii]ORX14782.1 arabinose ABC transporter permease [Mycolicibacterium wolinskyi]
MALTRSQRLTLIAAYLGLFVGLVDANAVNLALPAIGTELGGGVSAAQWTIDAYNVTFAALLLAAGSLGDRFGRRRLLRIGLVTFVAASLACALAATTPFLLAARAVQGVGAAMMLPQGLAITAAAFPDPADRARSTAAWAMAAASSTAIGPLLGGVLADTAGWRWIFWLNAPVGVLALLLSYRHLPESRDPAAAHIDPAGQLLAVLALGSLTVALIEGRAWPPDRIAAVAIVAVLAVAGFFLRQRRSRNPMLPLDMFGSRRLVAALLATFVMTFGIYGLLLVNTFAFQQLRWLSALATAVWFLPMPVTYLLLIPAATSLTRRTSSRTTMTAGLVLMACGLLLYAAAGATSPIWLLETSFVLAGAGLALTTGPAVALAMEATPVRQSGMAASVVNLARLLGITVGVAVLGSTMAAIGGDAGVRAALLLGGLCQLAAAIAVTAMVRTRETEACRA